MCVKRGLELFSSYWNHLAYFFDCNFTQITWKFPLFETLQLEPLVNDHLLQATVTSFRSWRFHKFRLSLISCKRPLDAWWVSLPSLYVLWYSENKKSFLRQHWTRLKCSHGYRFASDQRALNYTQKTKIRKHIVNFICQNTVKVKHTRLSTLTCRL